MTEMHRHADDHQQTDLIQSVDAALISLFQAQQDRRAILVAVSGGPDSIVLLHRAATVLERSNDKARLIAVSIDHGLRDDSATDSDLAAAVASKLGVQHRTLRWEGSKPVSGIHSSARDARYRLLIQAARDADAGLLLTAHHLDDQAETVLMRLLRTSSLRSLAGIAPSVSLRDGLMVARPFLGVSKSDLAAIVKAEDLKTVQDPANSDRRFERSRLRTILPRLARAGLSAQMLAGLSDRARRLTDAVEEQALVVLADNAHVSATGRIRLPLKSLAIEPAIALRVIARLLVAAGGADRYPAPVKLERLFELVMRSWPSSGLGSKPARAIGTLTGAKVSLKGAGDRADLIIEREFGRISDGAVMAPWTGQLVWDRRFALSEPTGEPGLFISPLGQHRRASGRWASLPIAISNTGPGSIAMIAQQLSDRPGLEDVPVMTAKQVVSERLLDRNLATLWEFVERWDLTGPAKTLRQDD